jgi:hypothetical protein
VTEIPYERQFGLRAISAVTGVEEELIAHVRNCRMYPCQTCKTFGRSIHRCADCDTWEYQSNLVKEGELRRCYRCSAKRRREEREVAV